MNSSHDIRPALQQKDARIDGHLWITTLAYHLIQSCIYPLKKQELSYQWETLRNKMSNRIRITLRSKIKNGQILYYRSTTKAEEYQKQIYQALDMTTQILKEQKTIG